MKHRHKAEKSSQKYLSVIIDGMDQSKTNIPQILKYWLDLKLWKHMLLVSEPMDRSP